MNPEGRTGVCLRGVLGRWGAYSEGFKFTLAYEKILGPNHAADPIVTRWKRNENNQIVHHHLTLKPILQFVSILRRDVNEWAIPGVDY